MEQKRAKDLVTEASKQIETLAANNAVKLAGDPNTVFVDVREGEELEKTRKLQGAVHVPRGFLEFQVDPNSPTHKTELGGGKRLVLYCGSGNRSALAAKTLKEMGIGNVAHVEGGFPAACHHPEGRVQWRARIRFMISPRTRRTLRYTAPCPEPRPR